MAFPLPWPHPRSSAPFSASGVFREKHVFRALRNLHKVNFDTSSGFGYAECQLYRGHVKKALAIWPPGGPGGQTEVTEVPNGTPLTFGTGGFKGFGLWGSCGHLLCGAGKRVLVSVVTKTRFFY